MSDILIWMKMMMLLLFEWRKVYVAFGRLFWKIIQKKKTNSVHFLLYNNNNNKMTFKQSQLKNNTREFSFYGCENG